MPPVRAIDLRHLGRERVICCWQVPDGSLVDPGPESCSGTLMEELGDRAPPALLLTHIHFDHAGAAGALVREWPDLEVYVHEVGAPHLIDPSRLVASARRLYGDDFDRMWGEVVPVPEENLRVLRGGETVRGFRVAYTPGHASHHVAYLHEDSGWAFVGDVGGVRIPPSDFLLAPTPPPDIDVEAWEGSLDRVAEWEPTALALTHFGAHEDVAEQLARTRERLRIQADRARGGDEARFVDWLAREVNGATDAETAAAYLAASPPDQLFKGLRRYWEKRPESA